MIHYYNANHTAKASALHRALLLVTCFILSSTTISFAQTIGGNVYGAGNQGNVGSSSTVTLKGGTIKGDVYGGAREADVAGRTFVDVDATSTLLVSGVYGGNDVSGTIGTSTELPFNSPLATGIDKSWNSFVRIAPNTQYPVIIGSLYGGGNGAYDVYTGDKTKPELAKTYLEIQGGIFGNIYGGGNNATVTGNTVIYMNNQLENLSVSEAILGDFKNLFDATDYSTDGEYITFKQHVSRMFGGNNLAEMKIRPTWNLLKGSINNLYSGGNRGAMTNENGILLPLTSADLTVNNVYGGCRIADVNPGNSPASETFNAYSFPAGYATRVYITAGNINNVYGGNDISGKVHYGTNLAIFSNIKGDVYGGGNGSYAYTDKKTTSDYYYTPGGSSIESLFNFRPHIEKTLIHVAGNDSEKPITLGSVYCGGNSATLYKADGNAAATFRIGKNVTIGNVFLGSNGENMVSEDMLTQYADGNYNTIDLTDTDQFASYMDAVAVNILPKIEWEAELNHSTKIGSFFCGGNVGSMNYDGVAEITLPSSITITDKIVAGCNDAIIPASQFNFVYEGGILGPKATTVNSTGSKNRVNLTIHSKLVPSIDDGIYKGANIYGGCYNSGVVKGNVEINVNSNIISSVSNNITLIPFEEKYLHTSTLSIYGGGYGSKTTIDGNTTVNLTDNARVLKVFGGGEKGSVLGTATINLISGTVGNVYGGGFAEGYTATSSVNIPDGSTIKANAIFGGALGEDEGRPCDVGVSNVTFASTTATVEDGIYGGNHTARATEKTNVTISVPVKNQHGNLLSIYGAGYGAGTVAGFTNVTLNAGAQVAKVYGGGREGKVYNHYQYCTINGYSDDRQAIWTSSSTDDVYNTQINIFGTADSGIAHVTGNVYGAGYGVNAHTSGKTKVQLLGGTIDGDIYGGGEKGTMPLMTSATNGFKEDATQTIASLCVIEGGQVRNVFGGGYQGRIEGNSGVSIGTTNPSTETPFFDGVPTILRSAYGGGEMAEVTGTSTVDMYNGYIGYRYHANAPENKKYQPELKLNADDEANLLSENGNLYGAGFGEGAVVMNTRVRLYDGTIRNGLYGGGEIAAVGDGERNNNGTYTVNQGGQTNVYMYGGLVVGDVFGGGRGYSYDLTGNQVIGKTLYSDGYVFGKTNVEIYRGTIGTDESLALGHGNVFGGGNIGYVYSAGVKYTGDTNRTQIKGHYYENNSYSKRTEDCRVHIAAGSYVKSGSVEILGKTFNAGDFVSNDTLNTLAYDARAWSSLDNEGVTIRNAVFAGGNVSTGSDLVYANAVTVFGNATAAVVDVFNRDLISLGGEHVGGLYGDGNLTFVDGYRELNITNYGTDYYRLKKELTNDEYNTKYNNGSPLTPELEREKAYYMYDNINEKWVIKTTSGRTMNTIQRADFCGVFGSRFLLHGARDRVPDVVDYTNYTINRVGEVSLNTKTVNGTTHGNYFGIYNVVNELGALTSNVEFSSSRQADSYIQTDGESPTEGSETYKPGSTYSEFKFNNLDKGFRNNAKSHNMVALASGVYLELLYTDPETKEKKYGPVTGVIELDLLNVTTGEGGGYVYAKNEHGELNSVDENTKKQLTLSTANEGAITQKAFTYKSVSDPTNSAMQTSGNFVHSTHRVVDACFNDDVHFWYIAGAIYVYDQKISAFTGAARLYEQSINIPFSKGKVQITDVGTSKYYIGTEPLTLGNKTYHTGDLITYWDWYQIEQNNSTKDKQYQEKFTDQIYVSDNGEISFEDNDGYRVANEMLHDNGYLLTYEMTDPEVWKNDTPPTVKCKTNGVYGQREYALDDLVGQAVIDEQNRMLNAVGQLVPGYQAKFEQVKIDDIQAYICINTLQKSETEYIFVGELISSTSYDTLDETQKKHFSSAYICTKAGKYGGKYFEKDKNYGVLEFSALNSEDFNKFFYNREVLDLLDFSIPNDGQTIDNNDPYKRYYDAQELTQGTSIQTSTLYVPRESDILNLSKDRVVSVVLNYIPDTNKDNEYSEDEMKDAETHVVNIHIQFKSGQPIIGNVTPPAPVLPNTIVGLSVPQVTPGAYDIIGGGWEIFKTEADANSHKNGEPYLNNATPMYWYQDGYYLAYYAKTYLGKSYSNPVKFSVANYHRMSEVMNHKVDGKNEYMFIDHEDAKRNRAPKIYIDVTGSENATNNDLDYLADLYNASLNVNELEKQVEGCANLEFILRSDIAPKAKANWSSIASGDNPCFAGTLHGNGYTISGLNNSLFGKLCGKVYNLGVTGSFTGGGIADNGNTSGHTENCWVYTTGTPTTKAIIGEGGIIKNSYYHIDNAFMEGDAIKKDASAFLNGEVTYLLNSFHRDGGKNNFLQLNWSDYSMTLNTNDSDRGYVENYFYDGDFIYAKGTIKNSDPREIASESSKNYYPIYPDDYIFFGQRLAYNQNHKSWPNRVYKTLIGEGNDEKELIVRTDQGDRVYRASAYYMNKTESDIFFNTDAKFVDTYDTKPIHQNLSAIDFTGRMKDMEQLLGFSLDGLTRNLLVYAEDVPDNPTYGNVCSYLNETDLSISDNNYKTGAKNESPSRGHLVTKDGNSYVALTDHFLVDKENFHVPIAYKFADDKRMWYQRTPDRFAKAGNGNGDGWDIICLPFTAELVTTHQKGEITHFYQGSTTNHEYWLREFKEVSTTTTSDGQTSTTAAFASLAPGSKDYKATSTFLYHTYYNNKKDANGDSYQKNHYASDRTYKNYAYLKANTPYIIAFPGQTYHEFDMSGLFKPEPEHTGNNFVDPNLTKQVVTFVSENNAEIGVTSKIKATAYGYDFVGTYQAEAINGYLLNAEGSAFVAAVTSAQGSQPIAQSSIPFRGYMMTTPTIGGARKIFIGAAAEEDEPQDDVDNRGITVYGRRGGIYIESTLEDETVVTIYRLNGQLVQHVTIQPMGKVFVPVALRGIYIVNRQKVSVL